MSKPASFVPVHRLSELLRRPGGITETQAVARAEQKLAAIRERCVAGLDEKIDLLADACRPGHALSRNDLVARASEIFSIAATFAVTDVARAAGCLCDLLILTGEDAEDDRLADSAAAPMFLAAVHVHVDALRRLRQPERGGDQSGRAEIVAGLQLVARKFVSPERARDEDLCVLRALAPEEAEPETPETP